MQKCFKFILGNRPPQLCEHSFLNGLKKNKKWMRIMKALNLKVVKSLHDPRSEPTYKPHLLQFLCFSGPILGIRHLQSLLLFLAIVVNYIARLNVSVSVVAMTDAATTNPDFPEFDWSEAEKSYILSSFYWGYILTHFPAGFLVRRFGVKITLFIPTFATTILSSVTPYFIEAIGWQAYCVIRFVMGLFQGLIFPCIHEHLAKWSPPSERNRLGVFSYSGMDCGSLLAMFSSGFIASSSMGWPGISYVSSGICGVWCLLWLILGSNNAPNSCLVGQKERDYIERSMKREDGFHAQKIPVPWRAIWTSVPFIAIVILCIAQGWAYSTMQLQTPSYMHGVLGMDITSNALYSALPFLAMWCMSYVFLVFADVAMSRQWMSLTTLRKSINTVAFWGPAAALIGIGFLDKSQTNLAIALMTISTGLYAGNGIGSMLTIIDMSPNHSGMLMAVTNGIGNLFPLLAPLLVGVIVTDSSSRSQWQIVFGITAVVFFFGNLVYIIWGSSERQPWDAEDFLQPHDSENIMRQNDFKANEEDKQYGTMTNVRRVREQE